MKRNFVVDNITVFMVTLNNHDTVAESIASLRLCGARHIVVSDGGSKDGTVARLVSQNVTLIQGSPGIRTQTIAGLEQVVTPLLFVAEADQSFKPDFLARMLLEFETLAFDGLQARKRVASPQGFLGKGQELFFRLHQPSPGPVSMTSGPQLWRLRDYKEVINHMGAIEGYSFDTERAEAASKLGFRLGIGSVETEETGQLTFSRFLSRMRRYGEGDFQFYHLHKKSWSYRRKLKSIFHVLARYGVDYPLRSVRVGRPVLGLSYFWLICFFRNFFWLRAEVMHLLVGEHRRR